jgi:sugar O-acyltransferase (sialic acid O-acetyltransferase NeuD family)
MPKQLLIVGSGGYAKEIAQIARRIDPQHDLWSPISYVAVSSAEIGQSRPHGRIDYCDADVLGGKVTADVIIGIGDSESRRRAALRYRELPGLEFPNLVDPSVDIEHAFVTLGRGNVIHQRAVLTCDIILGEFNLFNKACIIAHDVRVGSFNDIYPAASLHGYSHIGNNCIVGAGARVLPKVSIADRTTIGAGAVVLQDILEPGHFWVGVPARCLR